ncbi:hypothetical protein EYC80_009724 [Monilinia laxa]|uniref:Uncharacterized protein n=1 Tax=Monilinia laxa TaxID=61186 RepID=A0A5N6JYR3_MONLA|nr:hypothetical protein EYC80_009724 [Monilinia laxa]
MPISRPNSFGENPASVSSLHVAFASSDMKIYPKFFNTILLDKAEYSKARYFSSVANLSSLLKISNQLTLSNQDFIIELFNKECCVV